MTSYKIERMEPLEKRLGVSLSRIGTREISDDDFEVNFELKILGGGQLKQDTNVVVLIYDGSGELIGRETYFFNSEKVFAFSSGSAYFPEVPFYEVKKIAIYPEQS